MKKTLLSIMTMAVLVSSTTSTAAETKDIIVSAEIPSVITVQKSSGENIDSIKLASVAGSTDEYEAKENIKFYNSGESVKVKVPSEFKLVSEDGSKEFELLAVTMGGHAMSVAMAQPIKFDDSQDVELIIKGKSPAGAKTGEIYSGTLELNIEPGA